MRKAFLACFLALALTSTALAVTPERTATYDNHFSDLSTTSTFYDNVVALYEYGLSVGKADGTYDLSGNLTVGEALIFSARVRSLLTTGDSESAIDPYRADGQWASTPYYLYLQAEAGLESTLTVGETATRGTMAHILVQALSGQELPTVNQDAVVQGYALGQYITDVTEYTPYYSDILTLYIWGVSGGYDATGSFRPDDTITRGATAAFVTRMVDEDLRITLDWTLDGINSANGITLASLIEPGLYLAAPTTEEEMEQSVRYMLANDTNVLELQYDSLTVDEASQYMTQALTIVKSYCEQLYNSVQADYTNDGYIKLSFGFSSAPLAVTEVWDYRDQTMAAAIEIHDALWEDGTLYDSMTQMELAWAYYQWLAENVVYDNDADDYSTSHLAYRALLEGIAVCDGYTGAYNLLLKLEGIDCYALSNNSHIWTVATLDGTEYHIDATWGDRGNYASANYFAMSEETSYRYHSW